MLKIQGSYFLPLGFSLSAFYNLYTGTTWAKTLIIYGPNQGPLCPGGTDGYSKAGGDK